MAWYWVALWMLVAVPAGALALHWIMLAVDPPEHFEDD